MNRETPLNGFFSHRFGTKADLKYSHTTTIGHTHFLFLSFVSYVCPFIQQLFTHPRARNYTDNTNNCEVKREPALHLTVPDRKRPPQLYTVRGWTHRGGSVRLFEKYPFHCRPQQLLFLSLYTQYYYC